jgi:glycosyltransferase involved in cell wall biosynthesis
MCCGKPILCSDVCDNPMIVSDGENGCLFAPDDVNDMVSKIRAFLTLSLEERIAMGERSRQIALAKFSSVGFIKKYIELIEN